MCEADQIPYPMSGNGSCDSLLFILQPAPAQCELPMQPMGTAVGSYQKSITSALLCFFISQRMYCELIYFLHGSSGS